MNKNIFMGLIFVGILAGAVGTGITEGLGAGFSVFGGSLVTAAILWWIFVED